MIPCTLVKHRQHDDKPREDGRPRSRAFFSALRLPWTEFPNKGVYTVPPVVSFILYQSAYFYVLNTRSGPTEVALQRSRWQSQQKGCIATEVAAMCTNRVTSGMVSDCCSSGHLRRTKLERSPRVLKRKRHLIQENSSSR